MNKMNRKTIMIALVFAMNVFSNAVPQKGTMTDTRDGKKYKTVKIGDQTWMAENLKYEVEKSECQRCRYGRLYTWNDAQRICPDGWHLPDYGEWKKLLDYSSKKSSNDEGWINLLSKEELLVYYNLVFEGGCGHDEFGSFEEMKEYFNIKGNKDLDRSICRSGNSICLTYSQKRGRDLYGFNAQNVGLVSGFEEEACDVYSYVAFWTSPDNENHFFVSNKADFLDNGDEVRNVHKFYVRCLKDVDSAYDSLSEDIRKISDAHVEMLTDSRDGKKYKTVKIGEQTWMAENLNYEMKSSLCYDNKPSNCKNYGRLYSQDVAQSVCPEGWHLPDTTEFLILIDAVGLERSAGRVLKSRSGWKSNSHKDVDGLVPVSELMSLIGKSNSSKDGNGTDDYGFSALPAGSMTGKSSSGVGERAVFLIDQGSDFLKKANPGKDRFQKTLRLKYNDDGVNISYDIDNIDYKFSASVRCLKDDDSIKGKNK